jgi:membrane-associated phospholipid phosphatase
MADAQVKPVQNGGVNLRPADLFAIGVPFLFGTIVLVNAGRIANWLPVAAACLGVAVGGFLCRVWASRSSDPIAQLFGNFYCILNIWVAYSRLNFLIDLLSPITYDRELQAMDDLLFGVQPSVWLEQFHHPFLTEILFISYTAYFGWQLSLGVLLYLRGNRDFEDYFLSVVLYYMLSYVFYALIPAVGPRFDIAQSYHVQLEGVWIGTAIRDSFYDIPMVRDCFPSGHTGLTLLVLVRAITKKAYTFFWLMLPFAALLIFSTVYCRFHYVTDLLCAIPFLIGVLCVDRGVRLLLPEGLTLRLPFLEALRRSPA